VAALVDTNVLVYRFDPRFPEKRRVATELLRRGIAEDALRVPHQGIVAFVQAVSRPLRGAPPLLPLDEALREAEEMLAEFTVLYPNEALLRTAVRGCAAYQLPWIDAHLWACEASRVSNARPDTAACAPIEKSGRGARRAPPRRR